MRPDPLKSIQFQGWGRGLLWAFHRGGSRDSGRWVGSGSLKYRSVGIFNLTRKKNVRGVKPPTPPPPERPLLPNPLPFCGFPTIQPHTGTAHRHNLPAVEIHHDSKDPKGTKRHKVELRKQVTDHVGGVRSHVTRQRLAITTKDGVSVGDVWSSRSSNCSRDKMIPNRSSLAGFLF